MLGVYLRTSSRQNKDGTTMPVPVDRVKPVLSSSTFPVGRRRVMLAVFGPSEDHLPTVCGLRGRGRRCVRRCAEKRHPPHPRRSLSDRKAGSEVDRAARLSVVIRGQDMRRGQDRRLRGRWRGRCAEDRGRGLPRQARLGSPPISGGWTGRSPVDRGISRVEGRSHPRRTSRIRGEPPECGTGDATPVGLL